MEHLMSYIKLKINFWGAGFLSLALFAHSAFAAHDKTMGIIGDSVATGAVANESVKANFDSLIWNGLTHGLLSPYKTQLGVNFQENAFAEYVASGFGVKPENVINVAVNGKRISSIGEQTLELEEQKPGLPDYIMVSYTANNACNLGIFTTSVKDFKAEYLKQLIEGRDGQGGLSLIANKASRTRPTSVYLLASLDYTQVLTNPSILEHEVPLHSSTVRCERFRAGQHDDKGKFVYLADKLRQMCPSILGTDPKAMDQENVSRRAHLKAIHTAQVEAQREAIEIMKSQNPNPLVHFEFIEAPIHVEFNGSHVANDCFHLSRQGQGILGLAVWSEIFDRLGHSK